MAANEIRIIGGKWKRRKLRFRPNHELRPTLGRVRETLGNWLRQDWLDANCLDLFAGSGALGIEALSLGAAHVSFVERNRRHAQNLQRTLTDFGVEVGSDLAKPGAQVITSDAQLYLSRDPSGSVRHWNLVFLDPPFDSPLLERSLSALVGHPQLADNALVYYECQRDQNPDFSAWELNRHAVAGDTQFGLLARP